VAAGATALVLFNRFYQPDLDLETLEVVNRLELVAVVGDPLPSVLIAICGPSRAGGVAVAATSGSHRDATS